MARYCGSNDPEKIFLASRHWVDKCLLGRKSVFTDQDLWSRRNISGLIEHYVENLDTGKGKFFQKLKTQLANASKESKMLAAEMLWVMLLCPTNITIQTKTRSIRHVWEFSKMPLDGDHDFLDETYLRGVGDCGIGYNNHRWRELKYFVCIIDDLLKIKLVQRRELLSDGVAFSKWLSEFSSDHGNRQLRHMLLFMLFPNDHDRIFSSTHRERIVKQLTENELAISKLTASDIDFELLLIRSRYEALYKSRKIKFEGLDFYTPPLSDEWDPEINSKRRSNSRKPSLDSLANDLGSIINDQSLTGSERLSSVKTRLGQGAFRANLLTYWNGRCAVTQYKNQDVLIASHIKPWRESTPSEKVSLYNGLLLTPNLDKAFDKGLISFTDTGQIIVSENFPEPSIFGVNKDMVVKIENAHKPFLAYHRLKYGFD